MAKTLDGEVFKHINGKKLVFTMSGLKHFVTDIVNLLPIRRVNKDTVIIGPANDNAILITNDAQGVFKLEDGTIESRKIVNLNIIEDNCIIDNASRFLQDKTRLTSIVIPNYIHTIGRYAFAHCSNLKQITLGPSVRRIGYGAFVGVSDELSIVYLGDEVEWANTQIGGDNSLLTQATANHITYVTADNTLDPTTAKTLLDAINNKMQTNHSSLELAIRELLSYKVSKTSAFISEEQMANILEAINGTLGTSYNDLNVAISALTAEVKKYKQV